MTRRSRILLGLPALALALLIGFLLALPSLVSSGRHRAVIESLASSITGRQVHVAGRLSLAILPTPQLIAERITITGADGEVVTARSLTLDIDVAALLRGRLGARSLVLQTPDIHIPWPLPQHAAPAPWLTALHAQITDGRIVIGTLHFDHVAADFFTGAAGAFSLSGTTSCNGWPLDISLGLGAADAAGHAPITLDARADDASKLSAHLSGTLSGGDNLAGTLQMAGIMPGTTVFTSGQANLQANRDVIVVNQIALRQGAQQLAGNLTFDGTARTITASLNGQNLALAQFQPLLTAAGSLTIRLSLAATNTRIAGFTLPEVAAATTFSSGQVNVQKLDATLPGSSELTASGVLAPDHSFTGVASLTTLDLPTLLAAYGGPAGLPNSWRQARFTATLQGSSADLSLQALHGNLGRSPFNGTLILGNFAGPIAARGQLHFGTLELTPLAGLLPSLPNLAKSLSADGEITADHASLYGVGLDRLLIDASFTNQLVVRRLSASLGGGLAASSFTLLPGRLTIARLLLAVPSGTPLLNLLPTAWQLPGKLTVAPLSVSLLAAGPSNALAAEVVASLGDLDATTAPIIDLPAHSVTGALTLSYPSAITALAAFGIKAGLDWPGAGSASLRANVSYTPAAIGLPNFVLSLGEFAANGRVTLTGAHSIDAAIDADTLALPALPRNIALPWNRLADFDGGIKLAANRILFGGDSTLGATQLSLAMTPQTTTLNIAKATLAGGTLAGNVAVSTAAATLPALTAKLTLSGADATALPGGLPFSLASGTLGGQAALTASGYTPAAWAATLAGSAALTATKGTLNGFNLAGLGQALHGSSRAAALNKAATTGASAFNTLTIAGTLDHGSYTLTTAALQGPDGTASAAGSIDFPDSALTIRLALLPSVTPPVTIGVSTIGSWSAPRQVTDIDAGLNWQAAP